jgi:protein-disulfide isomerase
MAKKNKKPPVVIPQKKGPSFAVWVTTAAVVVILALVALVVWVNGQAGGPARLPDAAAGSSVIQEDGGIVVKDGPTEVGVYIDPMCPACRDFEENYTPLIMENDEFGLKFHPISILDRMSQGTEYSTRSSASIYAVAVASPDATADYVENLYANQPSEGSPGFSNEELVALAADLGATISEDDIDAWTKYVRNAVRTTPIPEGATGVSTPTVTINGEAVNRSGNPETDIQGWLGQ